MSMTRARVFVLFFVPAITAGCSGASPGSAPDGGDDGSSGGVPDATTPERDASGAPSDGSAADAGSADGPIPMDAAEAGMGTTTVVDGGIPDDASTGDASTGDASTGDASTSDASTDATNAGDAITDGAAADDTTLLDATPETGTSGVTPSSATTLAAGTEFICAVVAGGGVNCWGRNDRGQLGVDESTGPQTCMTPDLPGGSQYGCSAVPVSVCATGTMSPCASFLTGAVAVAAGDDFVCAVVSGGAVDCWGDADQGQLGNGEPPYTVSTLATPAPVCAPGGSAPCTSFLTGAVAVAAGYEFTCALMADGAVACWGANLNGQLGDGTVASGIDDNIGSSSPVSVCAPGASAPCTQTLNATAIAAGFDFACAVVGSGGVQCWGGNDDGQLGVGAFADASACGTTTCSPTPMTVKGVGGTAALSGATAVAAGEGHACAIVSGGAVVCWGENTDGELGDGTTTNSSTPVAVCAVGASAPCTSYLTGVTAITASDEFTCALLADGTVACWGVAGVTYSATSVPVLVPSSPGGTTPLSDVVTIASGAAFSCAVQADQSVYCWGTNSNSGEFGNGSL